MFDFTQITLVIGKYNKNTHAIDMLGTGFLISNEGKVVTARHVVGNETNDLCVLLPHIPNINVYQDVTDLSCRPATAIIEDINPITDLCILKTDLGFNGNLPPLESLDNIPVGEKIGMFGFPHCVMGRRVLTYQETEIGAKMLLETSGIKSKYATINIQTRPGQSGSLVFNIRTGAIVGLLIGTYAPASGVIIAGINPHELNQTSYCISANHIKVMIEIDDLSLNEWYACLKPYQKVVIEQLVSKYGEEKAAEEWLTARGPIQTATFGGSQTNTAEAQNYWSRLKDEFDKLICGHPDYEKEQKKFLAAGKSIGLGSVTALSNWLSPIIGMTPAILVPAIILILHTTSKMGVKAYCSTKHFVTE